MNRVSLAVIATIMLIAAPGITLAAPWNDAQKCSAFKWKAAGTHLQCLLREDARALKAGKSPDYASCERKLVLKYTRADLNWACETEGEAANIRDLLGTCAEGARTTTANGIDLVGVEPGWVCAGPAPGGCTTVCGDGIRAGDELCDDGNATDGDGCSAACTPETLSLAGHWRVDFSSLVWPATFSPDGTTMVMQNVLDLGCGTTCIYAADLGDCSSGGDQTGCTLDLDPVGGTFSACEGGFGTLRSTSPDSFTSTGTPLTLTRLTEPDTICVPPSFPLPFCGDGDPLAPEACDDGNNISGDGCSADCQSDETCGNGITDEIAGEECDDGNTLSEDGCTAACQIERCGDGIEQPNEVCDDGNSTDGDGCSADCRSNETCGNGITDGAAGEQCDGQEECNPDCTSPYNCNLSGEYSSTALPGGFLLEDDQMGGVLFSFPTGGGEFQLTYETRLPGSPLSGFLPMQILSCLPPIVGVWSSCNGPCTGTPELDTLTWIGPLPEPSASGAFLDAVTY